MSIVYLNGEFLPVTEARVSVLDRGFTFADSVYEVIPVYNENIFRVQEHLQRLNNSLNAIAIANPFSESQWQQILTDVLKKNPSNSSRSLYMQVTRGVSDREHLHMNDLQPTVFVMSREVREQDLAPGVKVITHEDIRWDYCHIKTTALLANVMLKRKANDADGAVETILIRDGMVTEGAASNVFVVKNSTVVTARKDGSVLPGITRDLLLELLDYAGIQYSEDSVPVSDLESADEVWLTSSSMGVAPVVRVDERDVADGKTGPMWKKVDQLFKEFKSNPGMLK
ncbi:MAG: D-amino acid aminotransferase [Gammaproteobacteria bacterium]|nr:D-amino acid aminotransferase [Gammaproteobacteria bacterium]